MNDFAKISKRIELEVSMPLYESTYFIDSLLKERKYDLKVSPEGTYFVEEESSVESYTFSNLPLNLDLAFERLALGNFPTSRSKIPIQEQLFDYGRYERVDNTFYSITSSSNNQVKLRTVTVVEGTLNLRIANAFSREVSINVVYPHIIDNANQAAPLSRNIRMNANSNYDEAIDLSNYSIDFSKGDLKYNQISAESVITVLDPTAQNSNVNSLVTSNSGVFVDVSMLIKSVSYVEGALPNLELPALTVSGDITSFNEPLINEKDIRVAAPVLKIIFTHTDMGIPINYTATALRGELFDGTTIPIPFKTLGQSYPISVSPAPVNNTSTIENTVVLDGSVIDANKLEDALYSSTISDLKLDVKGKIPEADADIDDYYSARTTFGYQISTFIPMRIDVDNVKTESADFDYHNFVTQVDSAFNSIEGKVSKIVLSLTVSNRTPFRIAPQFRLYKKGVAIDSLLISNDFAGGISIPPGQIDINGIVVGDADPKKVYLVEIDRERWDRLRDGDAIVTELTYNSFKSTRVDYVVIQNTQRIGISFKVRKLVFSTPSL